MAAEFVLFCKSYSRDVLRVKRLLETIERFNSDSIPFYLSTPEKDKELFSDVLGDHDYKWVSDESICVSNSRVSINEYRSTSGGISQQVIKAEFWRLNKCDNYLCLDSDSVFLKDFYISDFINADGNPFSVMHTGDDFFREVKEKGKDEIINDFVKLNGIFREMFDRNGPEYDFGPAPFIWSGKVWEWLDKSMFKPKNITIWDAVKNNPSEIRWYGESLLAGECISVHAIEPLFKVYHYYWQYKNDQKKGIDEYELSKNYIGVIYQSNWDKKLDPYFSRKSIFSRCWRKVKMMVE